MNQCRRGNAAQKTEEGSRAGRSLPKHRQHERGKHRRVHETEHQLNHIHGIVIPFGEVSAGDAQQHSDHGNPLPHSEIMLVAFVRRQVGLVKIVGPNCVEGRDIAGHSGHERREQRRQRQPQQARRAILFDQRQNHAIVIVFDNGVLQSVLDGLVIQRSRVFNDGIHFGLIQPHADGGADILEGRRFVFLLRDGLLDSGNRQYIGAVVDDFGWQAKAVLCREGQAGGNQSG